ncbi:hypothetical protein N302_07165, partial [Corvus brachyrhynchos]
TVRIPVGTVVSSSIIWNDIFYCKNTLLLDRNSFNHVSVCLK